MDKNERCRKLPVLHTRKVEWKGGKTEGNNITLAYPDYEGDVDEWIDAMYRLNLMDRDYPKHCDKIEAKARKQGKRLREMDVSKLSRDEILSVMTYIIRSERFGDGEIAGCLEDGFLEALSVRLNEITQ